jgi:hypothetical protein
MNSESKIEVSFFGVLPNHRPVFGFHSIDPFTCLQLIDESLRSVEILNLLNISDIDDNSRNLN